MSDDDARASVANFVDIAVDDLTYLGEQMRYLLALTHEERVVLFHKPFAEDPDFARFVASSLAPTTTTTSTATSATTSTTTTTATSATMTTTSATATANASASATSLAAPAASATISEPRGLCSAMLSALWRVCWPTHGRALLLDSQIIDANGVDALLACTDSAASHSHFANMCLALWMLSMTQFVSRNANNNNNNNNSNNHNHNNSDNGDDEHRRRSLSELLDDFVLWLLELRTRDATTSHENYATFVFNMALLHFLYQMALRLNVVKLKAVVLKAFFPIWLMNKARTQSVDDASDAHMALVGKGVELNWDTYFRIKYR